MQSPVREPDSNTEEIVDLGKYIKLIKNSWLKISVFTILVTSIAVLVALSITPKYKATATLLIEAKAKNAISIEEVVGIDSTQKEYYLTQFEILKSNQIAERVIAQLSLADLEEFNSELKENSSVSILSLIKDLLVVNKGDTNSVINNDSLEATRQSVLMVFKSNLSIVPIRKTQLVQINYISQDPELAASIANAVGRAYIELNLEARLFATQEASAWITNRLNELKFQLNTSEMELTHFLSKEQLIDDSGIDALTSAEIANLSERLAVVTDRRIEVESAFKALRSGKGLDLTSIASIPSISAHPQVVSVRQVLIEAEAKNIELSQRYGAKHAKMVQATAQLELVRKQATAIVSQLIKGMGKELSSLKTQEGLLRSELEGKKGEFQRLTVKKRQYESLKREVNTNRNVLNLFLNRQKETTATGDFVSANARFTDEALIPQTPAAPNKKLIVVLAFIASLGFGVLIVFLSDILRNTIESIKHFEERFGLVPLGALPKIKAKRFKNKPLDSSVFFDDKETTFIESVRSIRTSLMLSYMNNKRKRVAVTSSLPGEGKTTASINLAMSFAKMENVLLIDCDLRKPAISERFGMKKYQQGVSNHLLLGTDINECLIKDKQSGLTILPAGMLTSNPQELLGSNKFSKLLEQLDSKFDRIIIDTPPTLPVSDSLIISQLTEAVIVVIKANSTHVDAIKNTLSKITSHEILLDGIVINQVNYKLQESKYGYGEYSTSVYGGVVEN